MTAANSISSQYSDIVSLAMRQAMGSMEITVGTNSNGSVVPSDLKIFMKNIGTDQFVLSLTLTCERGAPSLFAFAAV